MKGTADVHAQKLVVQAAAWRLASLLLERPRAQDVLKTLPEPVRVWTSKRRTDPLGVRAPLAIAAARPGVSSKPGILSPWRSGEESVVVCPPKGGWFAGSKEPRLQAWAVAGSASRSAMAARDGRMTGAVSPIRVAENS